MEPNITIIGGGLAGCEAALMAARIGAPVLLLDMKPKELSPAHKSPYLGELVCSNSLRSDAPATAVGLLKMEMALFGSAVIKAARAHAVPAGSALAVDREAFARTLDHEVSTNPSISRISARVDRIPASGLCIVATGPLTAGLLADELIRITGSHGLHFYDALAPIVTLESVDIDQAFWASRYQQGAGDYLNCPLTTEQFGVFYQALTSGNQVPLHEFEDAKFFEGCLPIEVMADRGENTLLFGPMKPVGLIDPRTGRRAHALVQLRKEDLAGRLLNMVGFQTKLTYKSQKEVFRLIPALRRAEFTRLGSIHRNTFLNAPRVMSPDLTLKAAPHIFIAGQLSGVEGYVESAAMGMLAGFNAARRLNGLAPALPPNTTAFGGLLTHLGNTAAKSFQPSNVTFGLLPHLDISCPKKERRHLYARRALTDFTRWLISLDITPASTLPEG